MRSHLKALPNMLALLALSGLVVELLAEVQVIGPGGAGGREREERRADRGA